MIEFLTEPIITIALTIFLVLLAGLIVAIKMDEKRTKKN